VEQAPQRKPITWRAFLLGLGCSLALCGVTPYNDFKIGATYLAGNHLPIASFFVLLLIILGPNAVLRRIRPTLALQPGELLTIWAMCAVSSGLPSSALCRYLIPHIIAGLQLATPENGWAESILTHLPAALQIQDPEAVRFFFDGLWGRGEIPWALWVRPLVVYCVFCAALFAAFLCLSVLLRREWVEHERFTFPLAQLPVELMDAPEDGHLWPPLLRHRGMWAAVLVLTIIHTLNGLHRIYAAVPEVNLNQWRIQGLSGRGWQRLNGTWLYLFPLAIGFSFLINNEVLTSLWLFHVLYKLVLVGADLFGITPQRVATSGYGSETFASQEAAGAALALTIWMVWAGRHQLTAVARRACDRGDPLPGEREEGLPYPVAFWGLIGSVGVMFAWLVRFGGGVGMACGVLLFAFVSFITLTWLVAQAGLLFVQPVWAGRELMVRLFGSRVFTPRAILVNAEIEHIYALDLREFVLPHIMNVQKASDAFGTSRRGLLAAMAVALVGGTLISIYASVRLPYDHGALVGLNNLWTYKMSPELPLKFLDSLRLKPEMGSPSAWWNVVGGFGGMWLVMLCRANLPWFRLHPAGFIIASGMPLRMFWFSFFLGWLMKNALLRAGGLRLYRQARPVFLGLVLGDCLNGGLWIILSAVLDVQYRILPG